MITINVRNPEGNVFCILGHAESFKRQFTKAGIENLDLDNVLTNYTGMSYDEILDGLEKTKLFKFTGRKKNS